MKLHYIIPILSLISCSSDGSTIEHESDSSTSLITLTHEQIKAAELTIGPLKNESFKQEIKVNGRIKANPSQHFFLSAYFPGYVKEMNVIPGTPVKKGQVLARVEHPDLLEIQQNYSIALSDFNYLEQEYKRLRDLEASNAIAKKEVSKVKNERDIALAKRNNLALQLELVHLPLHQIAQGNYFSSYPILALSDGIVTQVNCTNGEFVGAEKQLFGLVNKKDLLLELELFEKDAAEIREGQEIQFGVTGNSEPHTARVIRIGTQVNADRRITITAEISNTSSSSFLVGGYVNAHIILTQKSLSALPHSAIVKKGEHAYALLKVSESANEVHFKQITLDIIQEDNNFVAIRTHKLPNNPEFLLNGVFDLVR